MNGTTSAPLAQSDATLVASARRGDLYAWERIVRRYQEPVFRVAYLIVRDTALAEAATQSTFIRAYRALPSLDAEHALLPWLFRIAAGESRQQRKESGRPRSSSRPIEKPRGPHVPATSVPGAAAATKLTPAEREALNEAFDRLGEDDRLTIASRYLFGLSRPDAAAALAIASSVIDERLDMALKRLRTRMAVH